MEQTASEAALIADRRENMRNILLFAIIWSFWFLEFRSFIFHVSFKRRARARVCAFSSTEYRILQQEFPSLHFLRRMVFSKFGLNRMSLFSSLLLHFSQDAKSRSRVFQFIFRMKKGNDFHFRGISMTISQFDGFIHPIHLDFPNTRESKTKRKLHFTRIFHFGNRLRLWKLWMNAHAFPPPSFRFTLHFFLSLSAHPLPLASIVAHRDWKEKFHTWCARVSNIRTECTQIEIKCSSGG